MGPMPEPCARGRIAVCRSLGLGCPAQRLGGSRVWRTSTYGWGGKELWGREALTAHPAAAGRESAGPGSCGSGQGTSPHVGASSVLAVPFKLWQILRPGQDGLGLHRMRRRHAHRGTGMAGAPTSDGRPWSGRGTYPFTLCFGMPWTPSPPPPLSSAAAAPPRSPGPGRHPP